MLAPPVHKDVVLVGGGHSHVTVLKMFGMRPIPGVRITLVSATTETPYSGMLPGLVAGHYTHDEAHIDLVPLCRFAGARFIRDEATGIDPDARLLRLHGRPPVAFDLLSINTGSTPGLPSEVTASATLTPVKPVVGFLEAWSRIQSQVIENKNLLRIGIVGGGAGGVELALAMAARLAADSGRADIELLTADAEIVASHNASVRQRLARALADRGIRCHVSTRITASQGAALVLESGARLQFDHVIWVTQAAAPAWLGTTGLALDADGFLLIDECLRSVSHPAVFGAGDVAAMRNDPRPKSGVFAVRQGPPLADNLRRALLGKRLHRYRPQRAFLSLIGTGDGSAVASRSGWSLEGTAVWRWKEWIDRRFMQRYQTLPAMDETHRASAHQVPPAIVDADDATPDADAMRCGGCGAKVSADVLHSALDGLAAGSRDDIVAGLAAPDDAALLQPTSGRLIAVSVDSFRPMIDDPWLFGRITANHCMNDLFAMGAEPQSALAIAALPPWPARKLAAELRQMLDGATAELVAQGAVLVGGHTGEGAEISLGFSVTGLVAPQDVLPKTGFQPGDVLILTKPLGTGAILAANMRGLARGRWLDAATRTMCRSNAAAVPVFREFGARACTDVTGFGLLGHLIEMASSRPARIELDLRALPAIDGALECLRAGIASTMQPSNERLVQRTECSNELQAHPHFPLAFDPQTAGGLLAAIPAANAPACVAALARAGFGDCAIVGSVTAYSAGAATVLSLPA